MDRRLIVMALGAVLGGTVGGYALGGYAIGRDQSATAQTSWWSSEAMAADDPTSRTPVAMAEADNRPERYVCHGCGPTLAERQAQTSYGDQEVYRDKVDPEPVSSYQPAAEDGDSAVELPDLSTQHASY